jgi:hypothetical protein
MEIALRTMQLTLHSTQFELSESQRRNAIWKERFSFLHYRSRVLRSCLPPLAALIDCDFKLERLLGRDDETNCYRSSPHSYRIPQPAKMTMKQSSEKQFRDENVMKNRNIEGRQMGKNVIPEVKNIVRNTLHPIVAQIHPTPTPTHSLQGNDEGEGGDKSGSTGVWVNFFPLFQRSRKGQTVTV